MHWDKLHLRETAFSGLEQHSNRRRPCPPTGPALAGGQRLGSSVSTTGSDTSALFSGVESAAVVRELASSRVVGAACLDSGKESSPRS